MSTSPFSDKLNPSQLRAVEKTKGALLILAGAGSGKTRALTFRMANLILQGEAAPQQILAVTFTNKAAREMKERITELLSSFNIPTHQELWVSTFHSFCVKILKSHIQLLGYKPFFVIYDDSDQLQAVKKALANLNINEKIHPAKNFKSLINQAKTLGFGPKQVEQKAAFLMDKKALRVYQEYENILIQANVLDFNDLLLKTYELFITQPQVLEIYQDQFQFLMVDEYQDTNRTQYLIIKSLAQKNRNICVVGDEDQSIYSWRGADIQNILGFEKDFPEAAVIKLEENYRSTQTIVKAASALIQHNSQRKNKVLFTKKDLGSKIIVREDFTDYDEARFVAQKIEAMVDQDQCNYNEFSIFYRTNAQSRVIEDQLRSRRIPYKIVGGMRFYERMEVKDILAYMRVILNPQDDIAVKRIINTPTRGIGKTTVQKIEDLGLQHSTSFLEACKITVRENLIHSGGVKKLNGFCNLIINLQEVAQNLTTSEIYHNILDETKYLLALKKENSTEAMARIENLEELSNAITQFEKERGEEASLQTFLEEVVLLSEADKDSSKNNQVTLMTLHISKGLEYSHVFIVGLEEGLFPSGQSNADPDRLEEERRLAYVGMTRARKNLFLSYACRRRVWGQEQVHLPSRFLKEIPQEFIDFSTSNNRSTAGFDRSFKSSIRPHSRSNNKHTIDTMPDYEDFSDELSDSNFDNGLKKGMRVRHSTFGVGSIFKIEGSGEQQKVSVLFSNKTSRKFITKYAHLEVL